MPDNERDRGRAYAPPLRRVSHHIWCIARRAPLQALQYGVEWARTCTKYTIKTLEKPAKPRIFTSPAVRKAAEMRQVCLGMADYWEGKRLDALQAALEELRD